MTYGEFYELVKNNIRAKTVDYRPAHDLHFSDAMEIGWDRTLTVPELHVWFKNSIIMWLKNGDRIIYIKKEENANDA